MVMAVAATEVQVDARAIAVISVMAMVVAAPMTVIPEAAMADLVDLGARFFRVGGLVAELTYRRRLRRHGKAKRHGDRGCHHP